MSIGKRHPWILAAVSVALAACGGGGGGGQQPAGPAMPASNAWVTSPVAAYGKLRVCGSHICAADGTTQVQLRGMSLFWSNTGWGAEGFYNANLVDHLADQWNATVIRAAIGAQGGGDYTVDPTGNMKRARAVIDAAIAKGMYVIVDWHSHTLLATQAHDFFQALATEYKDAPNVIWEPFNEPPDNAYDWSVLKPYHEAIVSTIRAAGSTNLVVAGSPHWSQDVDVASADPVADSAGNTAYTLHFYAGTHKQDLRTRAETAMANGVALFVTEWGTCDASGNGGLDALSTQAWLDWMDAHGISSANWAMNDKGETASALKSMNYDGPWTSAQLTDSGWLVLPYIHAGYANDLRVAKDGAGAGTVTSSPAGISCGSACAIDFTRATAITLTATPAQGAIFEGWSGDCTGTESCVVTMDAARSVTARFAAPPTSP
jgi:endoglucanase